MAVLKLEKEVLWLHTLHRIPFIETGKRAVFISIHQNEDRWGWRVLAFFSLIVPMLSDKRRYMIYHPTLLLIYGSSWGRLSFFCESKIWLDYCPALLLVKPWFHIVWFYLGFGFLSCDTLHLTSNQSEWEAEVGSSPSSHCRESIVEQCLPTVSRRYWGTIPCWPLCCLITHLSCRSDHLSIVHLCG